MESEIIAVIVLWIIVGPLLYKTFKNLFFKIESSEDKKTREKVEKLKAESRDKASKMLKENELKLEKSRKKREAEGKFLFDAPSKDLEGAFAKRAAFFANQGLDKPHPSEEELEQMKLEIESKNKRGNQKFFLNTAGAVILLVIGPIGLSNNWSSGTMFWLLIIMCGCFFLAGAIEE